LTGNQRYELEIKTEDGEDAGTKAPIWVNLIGSKGVSNPKLCSETGFEKGSMFETIISEKDMGEIIGITFTQTEPLPWRPNEVKVKYKGKEVIFKSHGVILACPANCKVTLENAPAVGIVHAPRPE